MASVNISGDLDYKAAIRAEWRAAAAGWAKWVDTAEAPAAGAAITSVLLGEARVAAGDSVLDLGSGYGEPGLSAAVLAGPAGRVTCVDIAGDMLAFAEKRARAAGLQNVSFVEADIDRYQPAAEAFEVVLSRAALMYATDPLHVLQSARAALSAGGRLAVAVWGPPEQVAFAVPFAVIAQILGLSPAADGPGPFALAGDGVLERLVTEAGFNDVRRGTTAVVYETASPEACTEWIRDVAPPITQLVTGQPAAVQDEVWARVTEAWAPFTGGDGAVRLPNTAVWVAARR